MSKKTIAGAALALALLLAGILAFTANRGSSSDAERDDRSVPATTPAPSASPGASGISPAAGAVAFPTPSLPAGSQDAETVMAINQIIFEVTQEAINRPKDDRMTSEEISALIQSRIEELRKRQ